MDTGITVRLKNIQNNEIAPKLIVRKVINKCERFV